MTDMIIKNVEDVLTILDDVFDDPTEYWNSVYQERPDYMSFLNDHPDENLVSYFDRNLFDSGKVLELGCGEGRNAIYMAKQGCAVEAIDLSHKAIAKGQGKSEMQGVAVDFLCKNVFATELQSESYDIVYDSGLMHHLLPHRRFQYIDLIQRALKPNGYLGLICFASGFADVGGPMELTDYEVYRKRNIVGGMAYSEEKLRSILSDHFELIEIRYMKEQEQDSELFGQSFLWASLWRKK